MDYQVGQTISADQFNQAYPVGQTISADQFNQKYGQQNSTQPSAPIQQPTSASNPVADFLGISKFGQGIATAGRVASGSVNQTGTEEGQAARDQQMVINKLQQLWSQGVPNNDLKVMQLENFLKRMNNGNADPAYHPNFQGSGNAVTQAEIDPGTTLSNKEVLGSAANTAILVGTAGLGAPESTAGKVAAGAALGYGSDVAQAANENDNSIFKPGFGTVVGAALPVIGKVGGAIVKNLVGATTGAGTDVIQRAIDNPEAVSSAINDFAKSPEEKQQLVSTAKDAINQYLQSRNQQFGESLSKMVATEPISKQSVIDSFGNAVSKFGGQVKDGAVVFGDTALNSAEQKTVQDVFDTVKSWKDVTPQGMDTLRQRIGNEMSNFKLGANGRDSVVLGQVKQDLTNLMNEKIPGYSDMLKTYGTQTQTARDLASELSLKSGNAKPATQLANVMKLFKKDPTVMDNLSKIMGPDKANQFLNDVSGAILSSWMPQQGIVGKIAEGTAAGAAGAATLMHVPGAIPAAAAGAAVSSPRLMGKAATLAGRTAQAGIPNALRKAATIVASKVRP